MLTTKMNWCARTLLALISLGCAVSAQAATITTFSTRTDFNAAVGTSTYETFDSVVTDTPFHSTAFDAGAFTLSMPLARLFLSNRVLNPALVLIEIPLNAYVLWVNREAVDQVWRRRSRSWSDSFPALSLVR